MSQNGERAAHIAMLTSSFDRLPETAKVVHAAALCLIGLIWVVCSLREFRSYEP